MAVAVRLSRKAKVFDMRRLIPLLVLVLVACGNSVERPSEESLRAQLAVLMNRTANTDNQSWDKETGKTQLNSPLPKGRAVSQGWMLEWEPQDGAIAYAIIPWSMLKVKDPKIAAETPYDGGVPATQAQVREISDAVYYGLDPKLRDVVLVNAIRVSGDLAAFLATPLLPIADDGYGFARKVDGVWRIEDLGSSEVGCGVLKKNELEKFKVECP